MHAATSKMGAHQGFNRGDEISGGSNPVIADARVEAPGHSFGAAYRCERRGIDDLLDLVFEKDKLLQDLDTWFREQYQVDRFFPGYGSTLPGQVGGIADEMSLFLVRAEAVRILNNYHQHQMKDFQEYPHLYSSDEVIREIVSVEAQMRLDTIHIRARIRTMNDRMVTMERNMS